MRETGPLKRLAYILSGSGAVLFMIFGLFPGSYPGGSIGLDVARIFLGHPVTAGTFSRWIVAASMAMGALASGIMFITIAATGGWLISTALYAITGKRNTG